MPKRSIISLNNPLKIGSIDVHLYIHFDFLHGLPHFLDSLCLKFTNEPVFAFLVEGDFAELMKRSASDHLDESAPHGSSTDSWRIFSVFFTK